MEPPSSDIVLVGRIRLDTTIRGALQRPDSRLSDEGAAQYRPARGLVAFVGMAQAGINLVRPDWFRLRLITRIVEDVAALAMVCSLLKADHSVVAGDTTRGLAGGRTVEIFNQCIFFGLLIAVIISGLQVLRGVHRLVRGTPARAPSQA